MGKRGGENEKLRLLFFFFERGRLWWPVLFSVFVCVVFLMCILNQGCEVISEPAGVASHVPSCKHLMIRVAELFAAHVPATEANWMPLVPVPTQLSHSSGSTSSLTHGKLSKWSWACGDVARTTEMLNTNCRCGRLANKLVYANPQWSRTSLLPKGQPIRGFGEPKSSKVTWTFSILRLCQRCGLRFALNRNGLRCALLHHMFQATNTRWVFRELSHLIKEV